MHPEVLKSLVTAIVLGLVAGILPRLLRDFNASRRLKLWLFLAITAVSGYLVTTALRPDGGGLGMQIFFAAAILLSANALLQLVNILLWDYFLMRRRNIAVPHLIVDVVHFAVLAIVAVILLKRVFHVDLNAFLVTSTVVSAVVGLSLQDVLGGVVAGFALQLEKPFAVGDWVQLDGEEGQVVQMSWRTVSIQTRSFHLVTCPNSNITKQKIVNFSRITPFLTRFTLGVSYAHPPGLVKSALLTATKEIGAIRAEPLPEVFLKRFDDSSIAYELRFFMDDYSRRDEVLDAVATRVWYALKRAGIAIPFPIRDVNVRMIPEDIERRREAADLETVFAELRAVPIFEGLSDAQIDAIARTSRIQRFSAGESLVVQGETGDSMFIVKTGSLRVEVTHDDAPGAKTAVATLAIGDFFGEMSLLTGEPRSASVVAEDDAEVVKITKAHFASIISAAASALDALSSALEKRLCEIAKRKAQSSDARDALGTQSRAHILSRIRGFFGM
ncbi:MAG: mechanosensitive ion channel family protein [Vicinamibacteria bacterium]|nr:mechanosensitive ion channel family protein [Vicinamibacteria bacterium]